MKRISQNLNWPISWKQSYGYDLQEVYGVVSDPEYVYQYKNRQQHVLEMIKTNFPKKARILDVAAAQGNFTLLLAEMGYEVTWNDLRSELIDYVKMKHEKGNIDYKPGNILELEFPSLFDIVLVSEVIEHVAYPNLFLEKIKNLVRPGGSIILTTPNGEYFLNSLPKFSEHPDPSQLEDIQFQPNSDGHIFLLWKEELEAVAKKLEMKVERVCFFSNPLTSGHLKTRMLLKYLPQVVVLGIERFTLSLPQRWSRKIHSGMFMMLKRESA